MNFQQSKSPLGIKQSRILYARNFYHNYNIIKKLNKMSNLIRYQKQFNPSGYGWSCAVKVSSLRPPCSGSDQHPCRLNV